MVMIQFVFVSFAHSPLVACTLSRLLFMLNFMYRVIQEEKSKFGKWLVKSL